MYKQTIIRKVKCVCKNKLKEDQSRKNVKQSHIKFVIILERKFICYNLLKFKNTQN